jgi:hypothetical protein
MGTQQNVKVKLTYRTKPYQTPLEFHLVLCNRHSHLPFNSRYVVRAVGTSRRPCCLCGGNPDILSIKEAARHVNVSAVRVYSAVESGKLPSKDVCDDMAFAIERADVEDFF